MTPQSSFMILASIIPTREQELRALLAAMNHEPGIFNPANTIIPFEQFDRLHFARIVILDDQTTNDITIYGLPRVDFPLYLALLGDCDGPAEEFLSAMAERAEAGLRSIFAHCNEYSPNANLLSWMKAHNVSAAANYVNWIGRTVRQIREEEALRQTLENFVQDNSTSLRSISVQQLQDTLKKYIVSEQQAGRVVLSAPEPTPLGWQIRNFLNFVGLPLLFLIFLPLVLLALPFFLIQLRHFETTDPEVAPRVDPSHANLLALIEDHDVTNQFSAMGSLKPGLFRRLTMTLVLNAIDYTARHIFNRGRLARVTSIQCARWVFLDGGKRVIFASNYDGSLESYMDDFINKVYFGLNVVFSNGIGYPRTRWLLLDGARDEQTFKNYLRRHQMPTQVWYNAFPGLTAHDKHRNALIREGLEKPSMTDSEIQVWLQLL
jgi:hypothetical protein